MTNEPGDSAFDTEGEALRRLSDPKFYLEAFCKIRTKTLGLRPFILNEMQKDFFNALRTQRRICLLKARQMGACGDPDQRLLTADLKWKKYRDISVGDELVSVDEYPQKGRGKKRKMRTSVVSAKYSVFEESFRLGMDDGRELILTGKHRMLSKRKSGEFSRKKKLALGESWTQALVWRMVEDFRVGDEIKWITKPWDGQTDFEDGWFGGLLDGEGYFRVRSEGGMNVDLLQTGGPVLDRARSYLESRGYHYHEEIDVRSPGDKSKLGSKPCHKLTVNRCDEIFRLFGQTRPVRFGGRRFWEGKALPGNSSGFGWSKVVSIELLGRREMVDLQTSAGTYVLEGFVSHNSTAAAGWIFHRAVTVPGTSSAIISYDSEQAEYILDMMKVIIENLPLEIQPTIKYNSRHELYFPKLSSVIRVIASKDTAGRGFALNALHCSEVDFWDKAADKMATLLASVPEDGWAILETTPNLVGSYFHRIWTGEDDVWCRKEYGWWWSYSQEEMDRKRAEYNDPQRFSREFLLQFGATGRTVFD